MTDANVWQPRRVVDLTSDLKSVRERFVATEGQSTFNLTTFAYAVSTESLSVYKNGKFISVGVDFVEQSQTSFSLTVSAVEGDTVEAMASVDLLVGDLTDIEQAVLDSAVSADAAQIAAWESEAEKMTADSWAVELEDVAVKLYTSDEDGTFTATDTSPAEYSALHHAAKSVTDLVTDISPQLGADLDLNGHDIPVSTTVQAAITSASSAIVGSIIDFAGDTVPDGYLECDGSSISRATYAALFAVIGTDWDITAGVADPGALNFRLPPQQIGGLGIYTRGVGSGNGVVGTYQADAFKSHLHVYQRTQSGASGTGSGTSIGNANNNSGFTGDATETRPRSITVLKCIKY